MENGLAIRRWCQSDCRMIYDWRMHPSVREKSLNKSEFPYEQHEAWFRRFLYNPYSFGFILEDKGKPVATVRFDKTMFEGYYNISIFTAPGQTGKGYGSAALLLAMKDKDLLANAKYFVAEVFEDNIPSIKIFQKAGFSQTGETVSDSHRVLLFKFIING